MGRRATGYWDKRSGKWYVRLGEVSPTTGRRLSVMLRDEDGQPITDKQAKRAAAAAVQRLLATQAATEENARAPTVAEVCAAFIAWHKENGSAERTIRGYDYHLRRFAAFKAGGRRYADRPTTEIGPEDLWAAKEVLGTKRHLYLAVLACWRWAARPVEGRTPTRLLKENLLEGTRRIPPGKKTKKLVGWEATRKLLRFARARARTRPLKFRRDATRAAERLRVLCLHFIAATGCRPHEATALEWSEIDLEKGMVEIPREKTKARRKGDPRLFSVPSSLLKVLRFIHRWHRRHPKYVFITAASRTGKVPNSRVLMAWFREELKPAALAAGVPIPEGMTLYFLRHSYATAGVEAGVPLDTMALALDNSPNELRKTYTHYQSAAAQAAAKAVEEARRKGQGRGTRE